MLCSRDFFNRSEYNNETKEQMWLSIIGDAHDSICRCHYCFAHLLACIFPIGHSDRDLTINQILDRDYKEKCRSGGAGDVAGGMANAATKEEPEDTEENQDTEDAAFAELLAAAEKEDATTR